VTVTEHCEGAGTRCDDLACGLLEIGNCHGAASIVMELCLRLVDRIEQMLANTVITDARYLPTAIVRGGHGMPSIPVVNMDIYLDACILRGFPSFLGT
jgi:hypothetical protein